MNTRTLFNNDHTNAGKGDKPRTALDNNFRDRFDEIDWRTGGVAALDRIIVGLLPVPETVDSISGVLPPGICGLEVPVTKTKPGRLRKVYRSAGR